MTLNEYLNLITTQHRDRPKYIATVTTGVQPQVEEQAALEALEASFDIDTATGVQLDILGLWIGRSRFVDVPLTGVYFSWNETAAVGWGVGVWRGAFDPNNGLVVLPDENYRVLLRAKIAANSWDGSIPAAYRIWDQAFNGNNALIIQDNQDMTMSVGIVGTSLDSVTRALLLGGYLPLKPEGVKIREFFFGVNDGPFFAWNVSNDALQGWGTGSWALTTQPT